MTGLEIILSLATLISFGIAVYELAVINERKKRGTELQYLLAGIHQLAQTKSFGWHRQIASLIFPPSTEVDKEIIRLHERARDDLQEVVAAIGGLEGVIDVSHSAIQDMISKSIKSAKMNNELQEVGRQNPLQKPAI